MIVEISGDLTLISVAFFRALELIDSGDTAVIRLTGADGNELAVMMPLRAATEMARSIATSDQSLSPKSRPETKD